jgi:polyisoprenoid-binding protein YceI
MNRVIKSVVILAAMAATVTIAREANVSLAVEPGSKLSLTGSSTVHAYSSTASRLRVVFTHEPARWQAALPRGEAIEQLIREHGVTAIEVTVDVNGLKSGKDGLDKNMYKALRAEKHPEICFTLGSYEVADGAKPGEMAITAKGKVSVAGAERELKIAATAVRQGDSVRLRGDVPLKMTQFGIKPPTMMMGTLRTSDDVAIHFDLLIGASQPAIAGDSAGGAGR